MVEFAFAGTLFLLIVFGTIDFGRVIFSYAQLHNAVREGARSGRVNCPDTNLVRESVKAAALQLSLNDADITVQWFGCTPPDGYLRVSATTTFTAITQEFLGISPIPLNSSARVDVE